MKGDTDHWHSHLGRWEQTDLSTLYLDMQYQDRLDGVGNIRRACWEPHNLKVVSWQDERWQDRVLQRAVEVVLLEALWIAFSWFFKSLNECWWSDIKLIGASNILRDRRVIYIKYSMRNLEIWGRRNFSPSYLWNCGEMAMEYEMEGRYPSAREPLVQRAMQAMWWGFGNWLPSRHAMFRRCTLSRSRDQMTAPLLYSLYYDLQYRVVRLIFSGHMI